MGIDLEGLDTDDMRGTRSQTEDSAERGYAKKDIRSQDPVSYRDLGQSAQLGQEEDGDIADEGAGHRG